ncbi:MAG: glutamine amidotransferase-related protein, partial [Flavobacteriales bacterium]
MAKKILLVDCFDSFTMNLHHYIEQFAELDLRRVDKLDLDEIENYDAIVLSPGPKLPKDFPILEQIIQNYHQHKPILGVCLGMQALADFFGFELQQLQQVKHGLSEELIDIDHQFPLFRGLEQPIFVAR